jgi:TonB family protein
MKISDLILYFCIFLSANSFAQDKYAIAKNCPKPEYPTNSRSLGHEGATVVKFDISEDGTVGAAMVSSSSGSEELDNASINLVKECIFNQKIVDGISVKQTSMMRIRWKLVDYFEPRKLFN